METPEEKHLTELRDNVYRAERNYGYKSARWWYWFDKYTEYYNALPMEG